MGSKYSYKWESAENYFKDDIYIVEMTATG